MMEPMVPYWPMYGAIYTTSEFESVFFDCIKDGNINWLDSARTDIRMNLNTRNDKGETPLLFAVRNAPEDKKTQIVEMLLSPLHILVDWDDKNGNTPLHEAISQDNPEITLALLYKHADINQKNSENISPLDLLSTKNCPKIKHVLENNPPKWLQQGEDYQTLYTIRKAAKHSSEVVHSKPVSKQDNEYNDFIVAYKNACGKKNEFDAVRLLQRTNIDIHTNHEFPLRWAARNGRTKTVKYLLDNGADIHAWNDEALFWAIDSYKGVTALELLKNGANPMARGEQEFNRILNYATTPPLRDWILDELKKTEQENYPFSSKLSPNLSEKYFYHTKVKTAIKSRDESSLTTSLFQACKKNYAWSVHQILKQNITSKSAIKSAFTVAACKEFYNRNPKIVHVLLEHGLNAQESTNRIYTQWLHNSFIKENGKRSAEKIDEIVEILEKFGGSIDIAGKRHSKTIKKIMSYPNKPPKK